MARILVVEDDKDFQEFYRFAFTEKGHEVTTVRTAELALEVLQAASFDLLVVDLLLPGMDGAELCRTLRKDPRRRNLPILMLSSMGEHMGVTVTQADVAWAPVDRFLDKSEAAYDLIRTTDMLLKNARDDTSSD